MDNSIENIWKEGFLQSEALVAPRINDLYNQKSKHIVERFNRMYRNNRIAILIGASVILLASILMGTPLSGTLLFLLFLGLNYYSRQQGKTLAQISQGQTSYHYLKEMKASLDQILKRYEQVYRWLYPAILLIFMWGVWNVEVGSFSFKGSILSAEPDLVLFWNLPLYGTIVAIIFAVLMSIFAGPLFRWDVKMVYGPILNKLSELIADMEDLRSQK